MKREGDKIIYENEVGDCPKCIASNFTFEGINKYTCNICGFIGNSEDFIRDEECND